MKILISGSECVPFAKTGGLADVIGSLPKALHKKEHDVRVIIPRYKSINLKKYSIETICRNLKVMMGEEEKTFSIKQGFIDKDIPIYFIENEFYYGSREFLYGTKEGDYEDNAERFIFFAKAVLETMKAICFKPDIIHSNDWQTGLIAPMLKTSYKYDNFFHETKTILTIHNMVYQGVFSCEKMPFTGISWPHFNSKELEYYGKINFLKSGIVFNDIINTVSETYSKEIQESTETGAGLDGVLSNRKDSVYGIINGVDYDEWDSEKDKIIKLNYTASNLIGKKECKLNLQEICGLPKDSKIPVIGIVSRLDRQKGFDIIKESILNLMKMDVQLILLGTGDKKYSAFFKKVGTKFKNKMSVNLEFDNSLAHKIYAGSDLFLMPSKFEPCGLSQLICFKYGTVPVVTKVGGLKDTVSDSKTVRGFFLKDYSGNSLIEAIKQALSVYKSKTKWNKLIKHIMVLDFSWNNSAEKYIELYKKIKNEG